MEPAIFEDLSRELASLHDAPREVPPFSERYPGLTAEIGYAAARRLHEQSRRAYPDLPALSKDADIPALRGARAEYAKLKG